MNIENSILNLRTLSFEVLQVQVELYTAIILGTGRVCGHKSM